MVIADNCTDPPSGRSRARRRGRRDGRQHREEGGRPERSCCAACCRPATSATSSGDGCRLDDRARVPRGRAPPTWRQNPALMAVGGLFYGEPRLRADRQFQRNEYARYQRLSPASRGGCSSSPGTASLIRAVALSAVAQARGELVPGIRGNVYDTHAMTEDNELTLALKTLGAKMTSPRACQVTTELMPTLAGAVAPAAALAARRAGRTSGPMGSPGDGALLGPAADPGLQRDRPERLPAPEPDHPARRRRVRALPVLDGRRRDLRPRTSRHRLGRRVEGPGPGRPDLPRPRLRPASSRPASSRPWPRSSPAEGRWNYVPARVWLWSSS